MLVKLFLAIFLVALFSQLDGQTAASQAAPKADWACVEDMPVPLLDSLMWAARASGTVRASITIGSDPTKTLVEVHSESRGIMVLKLKSALREAKFSSRCAGQTPEVNFIYRFERAPGAYPQNSVRFKAGNTFEIVSRPPLPITNP